MSVEDPEDTAGGKGGGIAGGQEGWRALPGDDAIGPRGIAGPAVVQTEQDVAVGEGEHLLYKTESFPDGHRFGERGRDDLF